MYPYTYTPSYTSSGASAVWLIIAFVLSIIGGLVIYFTFMKEKNRGRFTGFAKWLYEFLHFRKITLEVVIKVTYVIFALMVTLGSFAVIGQNFVAFLLILVFGNIFLRISYEFAMLTIGIWRNTKDIADVVTGRGKKAEDQGDVVQTTAAPEQPAPTAGEGQKTCPICGYVADADEKFCRKCGSPLP